MTWREFQRLQRVAEVDDTFISYVDDGVGEPSEPRHEPEVRALASFSASGASKGADSTIRPCTARRRRSSDSRRAWT